MELAKFRRMAIRDQQLILNILNVINRDQRHSQLN